MNYLLLISCSQRKIKVGTPTPAIHVYDGPVYRTLRKMNREGTLPKNLDILIISARYGLLLSSHSIMDYDLKMTKARASQPDFCRYVKGLLRDYQDLGRYQQVFINLGRVYMKVIENYHWGLISIKEASGGIGQRVSQMKHWIDRIGCSALELETMVQRDFAEQLSLTVQSPLENK